MFSKVSGLGSEPSAGKVQGGKDGGLGHVVRQAKGQDCETREVDH